MPVSGDESNLVQSSGTVAKPLVGAKDPNDFGLKKNFLLIILRKICVLIQTATAAESIPVSTLACLISSYKLATVCEEIALPLQLFIRLQAVH